MRIDNRPGRYAQGPIIKSHRTLESVLSALSIIVTIICSLLLIWFVISFIDVNNTNFQNFPEYHKGQNWWNLFTVLQKLHR